MSELSPQILERAAQLHQDCFVADGHYDLLCLVHHKRSQGRNRVIETDYLPALKRGAVDLLICSIFVDDRFIPEMALRHALDQIACLSEELEESGGHLALCRNSAEIRSAKAAGKVALLLSFEGVEPLGNDLKLLRVFYDLGVRGIGLTWSRRNAAADGCSFKPRQEGQLGGITHWGLELLQEAQRLKMYIDVSHLNDQGFWDLTRLWEGPFMASHSNCRALTAVMRNLDDAQIQALAQRGGVMGMNCCRHFVAAGENAPATVAELADHGLHVKNLVGARHLSFGFDFCDEIQALAGEPRQDCFPYYDSAHHLTAQLMERGFSDQELQGVLGGNILDFLERTIG